MVTQRQTYRRRYVSGTGRFEITIHTYLRDGFVANGTVQLSGASIEGDLDWIGAGVKKLGCVNKGGLTLKVSEKGAVSLYGMGRFPVTLYKGSPHQTSKIVR